MKDELNRIAKHIAYWESTIKPETYELAQTNLSRLAFEAMERDGQLILFKPTTTI